MPKGRYLLHFEDNVYAQVPLVQDEKWGDRRAPADLDEVVARGRALIKPYSNRMFFTVTDRTTGKKLYAGRNPEPMVAAVLGITALYQFVEKVWPQEFEPIEAPARKSHAGMYAAAVLSLGFLTSP